MVSIRKANSSDLSEKEKNKITEERKNGNFVQLYKHNITAYRELVLNEPVAASIFLFLTEHMNQQNAVSCSQKVFQEITKKSRTTVYRAVRTLANKGYINILRSGASHIFILNKNIVWTAWETSKSYCKFDGPILLAKSENEDFKREFDKMKINKLSVKKEA